LLILTELIAFEKEKPCKEVAEPYN